MWRTGHTCTVACKDGAHCNLIYSRADVAELPEDELRALCDQIGGVTYVRHEPAREAPPPPPDWRESHQVEDGRARSYPLFTPPRADEYPHAWLLWWREG